MRFLITGITGFAARHLARLLLAEGHDVFGTSRRSAEQGLGIVLADRVATVELADRAAIADLLSRVQPDGIFHLASVTNPLTSAERYEETYRANLLGSVNLFWAVQTATPRCRVAWIGSSTAYGSVAPEEVPITEAQPFRPLSAYAVSKAAADLAAYQWATANGIDIVRVRPFNHTGPGQTPQFVCADFARQIAEIERGVRPPVLSVGNLDVIRDLSDVRDVVRAYVLVWQRGQRGEAYNVCSGVGRRPREVLSDLLRLSGLDVNVVAKPGRQRPFDVPVVVGSAEKLRHAAGWEPALPWEQTLRDVLTDWRDRSRRDGGAAR